MRRPRLEVADIFHRHGAAWRRANAGHVSLGQLQVMTAIENCRSAVLGGHVDSREYGIGPLVALKQLRRGDDIVITTNRGTERFRVSTIRLISKRDLDLRDVFTREGKPLLRILTCGGTYRRSGGYQANVVVTARPA